jgi:hypothetical protein
MKTEIKKLIKELEERVDRYKKQMKQGDTPFAFALHHYWESRIAEIEYIIEELELSLLKSI